MPAATLVIWRVAPGAPTETSPAEPFAAPRVAVEPAPSATLFGAVTLAPLPSATEVVAAGAVVAPLPTAIELSSPALAGAPLPRPVIWLPPSARPAGVFSWSELVVVLQVSAGPMTVPFVFRTDSVIGAPAAALVNRPPGPVRLMLSGGRPRTPPISGTPRIALTSVWSGLTTPFRTGCRMPVTTDGGRLTPEQALTSAAWAGAASKHANSPAALARAISVWLATGEKRLLDMSYSPTVGLYRRAVRCARHWERTEPQW